MGLDDRLRRLEQRPVSDADLRDLAERMGRQLDLYPGDIYEEMVRVLAMPPAAREALYAQHRDEIEELLR